MYALIDLAFVCSKIFKTVRKLIREGGLKLKRKKKIPISPSDCNSSVGTNQLAIVGGPPPMSDMTNVFQDGRLRS